MTISNQTLCFEARRKCGVGFIHTQLASSLANEPQKLASSPNTVGFITRDFHALISRQHSQTNRRDLYTLFLTSKSRCMQKIKSVDALLTTQNVLSRSGRFGGGHTGWSQLQLASSVSPLWWGRLERPPLPSAQRGPWSYHRESPSTHTRTGPISTRCQQHRLDTCPFSHTADSVFARMLTHCDLCVNSLWPSGAVWHRFGWMACCLR